MTNLDRMTAENRLALSRKYFFLGLFCLPFVWLTNVVWFYSDCFGARKSNNHEITSQFRRYFSLSLVGASIWFVAIISWASYFQYSRSKPDFELDWLFVWKPYGYSGGYVR